MRQQSMKADIQTTPTPKIVLDALSKATISHFVCHAKADEDDPSPSGMLVDRLRCNKLVSRESLLEPFGL
jgi:hypothetical protein